MATGTPRVVYGDVPNRGLSTNLSSHGVVEVPCLVDASGGAAGADRLQPALRSTVD